MINYINPDNNLYIWGDPGCASTGAAWAQDLYGDFKNRTFAEIYPTFDDFKEAYTNSKLPLASYVGPVTSEPVQTIYYLLYGKYGNSTIASADENRFEYRLFSLIYQYAPNWIEETKIQKAIRELTLNDLKKGGKAIYNTALNPSTEPSTGSLTELTYINQQNTTNYAKSDVEAYALKLELLRNDTTEEFLSRFKSLFLRIVEPDVPLIFPETKGE